MAFLNKKAALIAGLLIFAFIISQVNLLQVAAIFANISPQFYLAALLLLFALIFLKGLKWKLILSSQGVGFPAVNCAKYFCIGFLFSAITPGRIGDLVRALYIRNASLPLALSSVVLDRIVDVVMLVLFASIASAYFFLAYNSAIIPFPVIGLMALAIMLGLVFFFRQDYLKPVLRPAFRMLVPHNLKQKVSVGFDEFSASARLIFRRKREFGLSLLVALVFWVLEMVFAYLLILSLGMPIPLHAVLALYPIMILSDIIPISISGLGTREAVAILFFSFLSLPAEQAVAFSLLLFFTGHVLIAFIGFVFYTSEPVDFKSLLRDEGAQQGGVL